MVPIRNAASLSQKAAPRAAPTPAATLSSWLAVELDKKLATLPTDQARYECLTRQHNVWSLRRARFIQTDGESEMPHPLFGFPTATDFLLVLCMIDGAKIRLEDQCEFA